MNIADTCTLLPAITKGHLDYFGRFDGLEMITDITKPSDDVWEFTLIMKGHLHAYVFLTEDARCIGTCYQELLPGREPGKIRNYKYIAVRVLDFNDWLDFPKVRETTEGKSGFIRLGDHEYGLLPDLRQWVIEAVANREHGRKGCDHYGRIWPENAQQCPVCGQPALGRKCDHTKFDNIQVAMLREYYEALSS